MTAVNEAGPCDPDHQIVIVVTHCLQSEIRQIIGKSFYANYWKSLNANYWNLWMIISDESIGAMMLDTVILMSGSMTIIVGIVLYCILGLSEVLRPAEQLR